MTEDDIRDYIKLWKCKTVSSIKNINWTYLFHHKVKYDKFENILWVEPKIIKTDDHGNIVSIIFLSITRDFMLEENFCYEDIFDFKNPIEMNK